MLGEFPLSMEEDELLWIGHSSGAFSFKTVVDLVLHQHIEEAPLPCLAWRSLAPPRVQTFVQCALKRKVLSRMAPNKRGLINLDDDLHCILCCHMEEDVDHLFAECPMTRQQWINFANLMGVSWYSIGLVGELSDPGFSHLSPKMKAAWNTIPAVILWSVWKDGNSRIFESKEFV